MVLRSSDEEFREPPAALPENWQENLFFILWDTQTLNGFMMHIQRVPGQQIQEARIVVRASGATASATLTGAYRPDRAVDGVKVEVIDAFREVVLQAEFGGALGYGPHGFVATRSGGDVPVSVDARLTSAIDPIDFADGLAAMTAQLRGDSAAPQMGDQAHYEQGGRWSGRLRIGDDEIIGNGLFVRDHSWGIRHEHNDFRAFWTATSLDDGEVFCNAIGIPRGDGFVGIGAISDSRGVRFTHEVSAQFSPEPGLRSYDQSEVNYGGEIDLVVRGETQQHWPFQLPFSGRNRYDNNAISRASANGYQGFSVMEWASTLPSEQIADLDAEAGLVDRDNRVDDERS